jgi:gentisate 1,2-dioxygenase
VLGSAVFHVIGGCGTLLIDGIAFAWEEHKTVHIPDFAGIDHANTGDAPAFPVRGHRNRGQETPGYHQERAA